jgi:PIN domain nuclease of toxin-antitoxin system
MIALDASALLAFLLRERGHQRVGEFKRSSRSGRELIFISKILIERWAMIYNILTFSQINSS